MNRPPLRERVQALLDEYRHWLREPPADLPSYARHLYDENHLPARREAAAAVLREIGDAVALLAAHGHCQTVNHARGGGGGGRQAEDDRAIGWSLQPADADPVAPVSP